METPTRFKKDLFKAIVNKESDTVSVDHLNKLLVNIGRSDKCLTEDEIVSLLEEAHPGDTSNRSISTSDMMRLV